AHEEGIIEASQAYICDLAKVQPLTWGRDLTAQRQTLVGISGPVQVLLPLTGLVDVALLRSKVERDLQKLQAQATSLAARLDNPNFVAKAAPEVVQSHQVQLAELRQQIELLQARLQQLA
ncbi:MAG: hypothetical protein Q6K59_09865, partial [Gloeomargarita sp. GMQP_bins_25]